MGVVVVKFDNYYNHQVSEKKTRKCEYNIENLRETAFFKNRDI